MSDSKQSFTPGPWEVRESATCEFRVYTGDLVKIATASDLFSDHGSANANLISAAPELLEHAQMLAKSLEYQIRKDDLAGDDEGADLKRFTLECVLRTIAKAGG